MQPKKTMWGSIERSINDDYAYDLPGMRWPHSLKPWPEIGAYNPPDAVSVSGIQYSAAAAANQEGKTMSATPYTYANAGFDGDESVVITVTNGDGDGNSTMISAKLNGEQIPQFTQTYTRAMIDQANGVSRKAANAAAEVNGCEQINPRTPAQRAYETYHYPGMPDWKDLGTRDRRRWDAVAKAVVRHSEEDF